MPAHYIDIKHISLIIVSYLNSFLRKKKASSYLVQRQVRYTRAWGRGANNKQTHNTHIKPNPITGYLYLSLGALPKDRVGLAVALHMNRSSRKLITTACALSFPKQRTVLVSVWLTSANSRFFLNYLRENGPWQHFLPTVRFVATCATHSISVYHYSWLVFN